VRIKSSGARDWPPEFSSFVFRGSPDQVFFFGATRGRHCANDRKST